MNSNQTFSDFNILDYFPLSELLLEKNGFTQLRLALEKRENNMILVIKKKTLFSFG